jgi:hypothetical protein
MKIILDVVLVEGTDKQQFVDSFDPESQADWWNMLEEIPSVISMHVEESYIEDFKKDNRVISAYERLEAFPANLPDIYSQTKTITASLPSTATDGSDYAPLQFFLDTKQISSITDAVGANSFFDISTVIPDATYQSRWTGKNVDIVTLEVGPISASYAGLHEVHPDFQDPDNPGNSRIIPMDWVDLEDPSNNQITSNSLFSAHGIGVLSAAGGTICGFAKKSNLRAAYLTAEDGSVECINAIISWHNNKAINPDTGVVNPTIMIAEYQYVIDRESAIPIDSIASITDLDGTVNKPVSGWGSDFTEFVSRGIIPFQVFDPDTSSYVWCAVFPRQFRNTALQQALRDAWDAGIVCLNAAGNNGGVYVKETDSRYNGVFCTTIGGTITYYDISSNASNTKLNTTVSTWYPFRSYGPQGEVKAIDVAAGYNSGGMPILDPYTNRGPGIDVVGLGANTWTAYPQQLYADGYSWGMFSGTSCATPTVVGKAACMMERYFYYNGSWPTPNQVKSLVISSAKNKILDVPTTDWSSVGLPDISISTNEGGFSLVRIATGNGNGGYKFTETVGTTTLRAFFDVPFFNNSNVYKKRPPAGMLYPRINNRII